MNINLDEKQKKNVEDKFLEFQRIWTLEKVRNMTLEEYTTVKKNNPDRNDFTFWIENKLDDIGSIWGGSSFKFGIYKRDDKIDKDLTKGRKYTQEYAWWSKYGDNPQEAFNKIKNVIKQIIKASQSNDLKAIENIKDLGHSIKWKIAFQYQNIEDIKIVNIFSRGVLEAISKDKYGVKLKTCEIYKKLLDDKEKYNLAEVLEISDKLWRTYGSKLNTDKDNQEELSAYEEEDKMSLNQILYGPPGTGKTYHTIDKALEILGENLGSRDEKKAKFDEYVKNGQIVFATFHQSYGYEEFVEGIKPVINSEQSNSKEVEYEIKDGVFKELCDKAHKNYLSSNENNNEIDLDKLIFEFANYMNQNFINKGDEFPLENRVNIKEILLNSRGEYRSFLLGGSIKSPQRLTIDIIKRDYLNFKENKILDYKDIKPKYESQSDYHGNAIYYFMFYKKLKEFENTQNVSFKNTNEKLKPYIIIIDEINRGNVSKIFGELITLIEPSKRIGNEEELRVALPYSGEKFGVPKNVYIIGTMNTADRSITSLDTALRRRFEFVEMMPKPSELFTIEDINLQELLQAINTRIEYLLDREKTIGHAFFMGVENLNDLKNVFQNKIIPLLQEYFYNDYALIEAVLNDNGMIFEYKKDNKYLQKIKNLDNVDNEKNIYNIASFNDKIWDKPETYQAIYDDKITNKTKNENE